jgi:hypothetical protein
MVSPFLSNRAHLSRYFLPALLAHSRRQVAICVSLMALVINDEVSSLPTGAY